MLGGSFAQYMKATNEWFDNIKAVVPEITTRPLYFVSSNTHSMTNILTGFALQHETELENFIQQSNDQDLQSEWEHIKKDQIQSSRENFLYYVLKKYQNTPTGSALVIPGAR